MDITLSTYFSIGFAIGTNDMVFAERLLSLPLTNGTKLIEKKNKKLCNRLGNGLTFDITATEMAADWQKGTEKLLQSEIFYKEFNIDTAILEGIKQIKKNGFDISYFMTLYSCGMGTVEVKLRNVDERGNVVSLFRLAQSVEFAGYSDYDSNTDFQRPLQQEAQRILKHCMIDQQLHDITLQEVEDEDFKYNFFPSFTILFNSASVSKIDEMRIFRQGRDDSYLSTTVDGCNVYTSWYTILINSDGNDTTIPDLVRTYNLFHGACEMMENIMNNVIYDLLSPDKKGDKLALLIKLQLTSNLIINNTSMYLLTQNEELMAIFRQLNKNGSLESYHQSIKRSLDVCIDIKSQFDHEQDKIEDEREKRRDDHINYFVIIFTSLTFVSVAADFLSVDQFTSEHVYNTLLRWGIYIAVLTLLIGVINYLFRQKKSD